MREFLKGEDITVLKNGNILGGIISVETQKNSTVYGVKQYMSDSVSCAHTKDEIHCYHRDECAEQRGLFKRKQNGQH